jgi:uracil-xanthine permease
MAERRIIQTDEIMPLSQALPLAAQHLMAMFGATVLVPLLTGLNPGIGLMTSGIGTLLYLVITRGKIPSYLGSSFAFITPIIIAAGGAAAMGTPAYRLPLALGGLIAAGVVYIIVAGFIKAFGTAWLHRLLPAAVVGAVVIVIGIGLSATAVKEALYGTGAPAAGQTVNLTFVLVAFATLAGAIAFSSYFKGFLSTIPVLLGIIVGYVVAIPLGLVDFSGIAAAKWIDVPWHYFTYPQFDSKAMLIIAPVALVVIVEHIGHLLVINEITGKDFRPMLPESLAGDGIATIVSAAVGGTPSTTYAENIGVMAVTKVYAVQLFWYAGALAFLIGGFIPKVSAVINSIPVAVMGGISILLFGLIASSGLRMLVDSGIDYSHSRNLILSSVVLIIGIGMETSGTTIPIGSYVLPGMALATILGIVLNLVLPKESKTLAVEGAADFINEAAVEASRQGNGTEG